MKYTVSNIARILAAEAVITIDSPIDHLLLDSRKVYSAATSLFFALKGFRKDGHQFITELYKKGVRNFVVSTPIEKTNFPEGNFLLVDDTLEALQQLAAFHRQQFKIPVIGITGSNGKTIVKEWLYQLLHEDFTIVRSPKSYNSQIGVPLSVW
ncbi:MAG: bifunctional UDP-N-acetylmuramoyl-tripeptide:D-alanyl-D-alanine ligase/alanine racemase, partial [Chitinophagaceae bacterium]|nr:bifunctional UDP-N-acetylmuramoyl-tripeptide:D-alanyl-D-alanine ligase/alanine racemase [Chitinophagaceae bacterium]